MVSVFALLLLSTSGLCAAGAAYAAIANGLPAAGELKARSAAFVSTKIYDREGNLLHEVLDPNGGRRTLTPLDQISPYLINATVATEDRNYWQHPGVDPVSIARAVWYNLQAQRIVSGFSTIPQQLVRIVLLSPEERTEQTLSRKIREAVLAAEVSRRYSKREVLEIYLNEIHYGYLAFGAQAAAQTYFGKDASDLSLAEAALLAGLPQAPAYWDPYVNIERAKRRQEVVLGLMVEAGYITQAEADTATAEPLNLVPLHFELEAPHFVIYVRQLLEERYGSDVIYRSGLQVYTTLDPRLQALAQEAASQHISALADRQVSNAALVAIRPNTGEVVAMLGSVDFYDVAIDGQVNVAVRPRQPGSSIKPLTYVAAFEKGWTPATLIWDVTTQFRDALGRPYVPKNYDGKEHGPVLVRSALANSYNIPAVKTLDFVGLPAFLETAHRFGLDSLNRDDYGLSLTLGGGDVTLLEMTSAYAILANGGARVPPVFILRIEDSAGNLIEEYQPPAGQQVISRQHAYLVTDILSDNEARLPAFGPSNALQLSRPAGAKTGTTDDWRDAWTLGYTPDLVAGVWVGNNDNSPMDRITGSRGAGPIWHRFMEDALAPTPPQQFARPDGIQEIEICALSGTIPSPACPADGRRREIFAPGQGPLGAEYDFYQLAQIDTSTGYLATEFCPVEVVEERLFLILPGEEGQRWAAAHQIPQPPTESCPVHTRPAVLRIDQPSAGQAVAGMVDVWGQIDMPDLAGYMLEYGIGHDPIGWGPVAGPFEGSPSGGWLGRWDVGGLDNGDHSLRLIAWDTHGNRSEARTWVVVSNPLPTNADIPLEPILPVLPTVLPPLPPVLPKPLPEPPRP
jgi:1A family penicillin-binding protein